MYFSQKFRIFLGPSVCSCNVLVCPSGTVIIACIKMLLSKYYFPPGKLYYHQGFLGGSEESACNAGDLGSVAGLGRSPGEGNSYPLQYSGLESSMDRGAWRATVRGVTKSRTQLSDFHFHFLCIKNYYNRLSQRFQNTGKKLMIYIYIC